MTIKELKNKTMETGRNIYWKAKDLGGKAATAAKNGVHWAIENPEKATGLVAGGAALLGGASKLVRGINSTVTRNRELNDKKHRIYDHSLNAYLYTKKPLSKKQIDKIYAERRRTGKKVGEIMSEMNLLKK